MTSIRALLFALAAFSLGIAGVSGLAAAQTTVPLPVPRPQKPPNPNAVLPAPEPGAAVGSEAAKPVGTYTHGRVIVLRGLYNFFSRGMDQIAKDLKARGVPVLLENHSRWQVISAKLIADYKADPKNVAPIILVGHSLGGDASIVMSNWLALNGVPVRFVVIFDAVAETHPIIGGVQEVLNYYKPKGYGQEVNAAPSFRGVIDNVDLTDRKDIDHLNIDKDPIIQAEVIARVMAILDGKSLPPKKAPTVAKAAPPVKATPPPALAAPPAAAATPPAQAKVDPPGTVPANN